MHQSLLHPLALMFVEIGTAQLSIGFPLGQDLVADDQDRMCQRHQRPFFATPSGNPPILSGQIGFFGFGSGMRNFNQDLTEPDIALAGLAAESLATAFRLTPGIVSSQSMTACSFSKRHPISAPLRSMASSSVSRGLHCGVDHESMMGHQVPHDRLRKPRPFRAQATPRQFRQPLGVSFSRHKRFQDGACGDPADIGDHRGQLDMGILQPGLQAIRPAERALQSEGCESG